MSYCRFSSDDFQCDVYVYDDVSGGWTTHVALNRPIPPEGGYPPPIELIAENIPAWVERHNIVMAHVDKAERISLSHLEGAGQSFNDPTPDECADRLERLRAVGFNVPQYAIDALRYERVDDPMEGE